MFLLNTRIDKCTVVCSFGGLVYMHEAVRINETTCTSVDESGRCKLKQPVTEEYTAEWVISVICQKKQAELICDYRNSDSSLW